MMTELEIITKETHPEHFCKRCGGKNLIAWYADADEWNNIVGDLYDIICPICFGELAELQGLRPTAWRISREGDSPEIDKLRERIHSLNNRQFNLDQIETVIRSEVNIIVEMRQFMGGFPYTNKVKEKERFELLAEYRSRIGYTIDDLMEYLTNQETSK